MSLPTGSSARFDSQPRVHSGGAAESAPSGPLEAKKAVFSSSSFDAVASAPAAVGREVDAVASAPAAVGREVDRVNNADANKPAFQVDVVSDDADQYGDDNNGDEPTDQYDFADDGFGGLDDGAALALAPKFTMLEDLRRCAEINLPPALLARVTAAWTAAGCGNPLHRIMPERVRRAAVVTASAAKTCIFSAERALPGKDLEYSRVLKKSITARNLLFLRYLEDALWSATDDDVDSWFSSAEQYDETVAAVADAFNLYLERDMVTLNQNRLQLATPAELHDALGDLALPHHVINNPLVTQALAAVRTHTKTMRPMGRAPASASTSRKRNARSRSRGKRARSSRSSSTSTTNNNNNNNNNNNDEFNFDDDDDAAASRPSFSSRGARGAARGGAYRGRGRGPRRGR